MTTAAVAANVVGSGGSDSCGGSGGCVAAARLVVVTVPRAPQIQSPGHVPCATVTEHVMSDTCYLKVPCFPTWSDPVQSQLGDARNAMLLLAPHWLTA